MVSTHDIIRGKHNKQYTVDLTEILTWYPGDYTHKCGKCEDVYHTCISVDLQWQYVLHNIIYPNDHYTEVYQSVINRGFVGSLRAKVTENDHVILLDGHNRVGVGLELALKEVSVYVADVTTDPDDLVAPDSGWWKSHQQPWDMISK